MQKLLTISNVDSLLIYRAIKLLVDILISEENIEQVEELMERIDVETISRDWLLATKGLVFFCLFVCLFCSVGRLVSSIEY